MTTRHYTVRFGTAQINTTVTSDAAAADEWVRRVRASNPAGRDTIVGLDCEWKPNYRSGVTSKVAILQLCVDTNCLILQMFYVSRVPASIRNFLRDPTTLCVGIGVKDDTAKLADDYSVVCAAPHDLEHDCNMYISHFGRRLGLKGYAREVLGLIMPKPYDITMSNWEQRQLDEAQVEYACIDAYVSYKLGERVLDDY